MINLVDKTIMPVKRKKYGNRCGEAATDSIWSFNKTPTMTAGIEPTMIYFKLVKNDPEFEILLDLDIERLKKITDHEIANKIIRMRQGKIKIEPGYDGIYGKISINNDHQKSNQNSLF